MIASDVFELLVSLLHPKIALIFTTEFTGVGALQKIKANATSNLVSLNYLDGRAIKDFDASEVEWHRLEAASGRVRALAPYDLTFVDPFHSYKSSLEALKLSLETTTGWVLVHDCLPTYELAEPTEVVGAWCGTTYEAITDLMRDPQNTRAWFIIDSDFGIGVMGPENSAHLISDAVTSDEVANWFALSTEARRELLKNENLNLFRPVHADRVAQLMKAVIAGQTVSVDGFRAATLATAETAGVEEVDHVSQQLNQKTAELDALRNSLSWRITKPLRAFGSILVGRKSGG